MKKIFTKIIDYIFYLKEKKILRLIEKNKKSPIDFYAIDQVEDSYQEFKSIMPKTMIFTERKEIRKFVVREALTTVEKKKVKNPIFLEFGVATGKTINDFAELLKNTKFDFLHGFDSFEGLQEDWVGMEKGRTTGAYSQKKILPKVMDNVRLIAGLVQDTLPGFLKENLNPILLVHMDMDTYTPGKFVLENIKSRLIQGSLILFDDFYGYGGWRNHDFKALNEVFSKNEYEIIAFGKYQSVIKIKASIN